ncbi:MAG: prolyl oligopeptidase family serine peptidase, partial [Thermomicrobiales bacterium]
MIQATRSDPAHLTPEELADRLVPGDPRISPDGNSVLFIVEPRGQKEEHRAQGIWLWRRGGEARRFSAGTAHDSEPRWSPNGDPVVFISDRLEKGEFRLYLIHASGGEAQVLGELQGELSDLAWSPDGSTIAVLRKEPLSAEEKKRKENRDDPVVADAALKPNRLFLVDAKTGKARCLTHGERQVWSFAWSRNGQRLAILTTATADVNTLFDAGDLWVLPASGGIPRHIATFPVLPGNPVFVEIDGEGVIAVTANEHRADPSDSVWLVPVAGGEPVNVMPDRAAVVERIVAIPDAPSHVSMRLVEGVHGGAFTFDVDARTLKTITPENLRAKGTVFSAPSLSNDGKTVALIWTDGTTPEEVYVGQPGGKAKAVTTFGASFEGRLGPVETVRWQSTDGLEIEGLLTLPVAHDPSRRYPLIVEIHGGPAWQWEERVMLNWHDWAQLLASHGYAVLLPNPRGSTGYGSAFQQRLQDDVGGGEAQDVITGARAMVERGIADPDRLGIGGWSWGGYLTAWTITRTTMFKAAVMGAGLANMISDHGQNDIPSMNHWIYPGDPYDYFDHYWQSSPLRHIKNVVTPTLIVHGAEDDRVHPAQAMEYHRALKTLKVPTEFVRYPRESHGFKERHHPVDLMRR